MPLVAAWTPLPSSAGWLRRRSVNQLPQILDAFLGREKTDDVGHRESMATLQIEKGGLGDQQFLFSGQLWLGGVQRGKFFLKSTECIRCDGHALKLKVSELVQCPTIAPEPVVVYVEQLASRRPTQCANCWRKPPTRTPRAAFLARPVREYLEALDAAEEPEVPPKNVSLTDPEARWTAAPGGPAFYAYSTN